MAKQDKRTTLADLCKEINASKFGGENKDALFALDGEPVPGLERFPSGSERLDWALGGGYPVGRLIEIFGPEAGGKTTLCLEAVAAFQKKYPDEHVAFIDSENSLDLQYAQAVGVDVNSILVNQPESGEQALNILGLLMEKGVRLFVVDSVAALTTRAELDGDVGDAHVAVQARMMSSALKKIVGAAGRTKSTILFTNQIREKIGVMYGAKTTTPGGRALKFYSSCRLKVSSIGKDKEGETIVGNRVRVELNKNKTAPPFRIAEFIITFGIGIDRIPEVFETAINLGVIIKSGSWFSFAEMRLGQGRTNCLNMLRDEENSLLKDVEKAIAEAGSKEAQQPKKRKPTLNLDALDGDNDVSVEVV